MSLPRCPSCRLPLRGDKRECEGFLLQAAKAEAGHWQGGLGGSSLPNPEAGECFPCIPDPRYSLAGYPKYFRVKREVMLGYGHVPRGENPQSTKLTGA